MIKNDIALMDALRIGEILTTTPVSARFKTQLGTKAGESIMYLLAVIKEQDKDIYNLSVSLHAEIEDKRKMYKGIYN